MRLYRVTSHSEWLEHDKRMSSVYHDREDYERRLIDELGKGLFRRKKCVSGFSYTAGKEVCFPVDIVEGRVNWRESLVCPVTHMNNRMRASIHIFDLECGCYPGDRIYVMEQTTPTYRFLANHYSNVMGSEYLGEDIQSGDVVKGIRHVDVTDMPFDDESLSYILSFDVFEHVPDYLAAFSECYRVLQRGGAMIWSVPFIKYNPETLVRAKVNKHGEVEHLLEPEYHGDPVQQEGILCYYHFGWDMLDKVRAIGFDDVYAVSYWSDVFAYLGTESLIFVARKPS